MAKRSTVVGLTIPVLLVGILAVVALWRVGLPPDDAGAEATHSGRPDGPLAAVADILTTNAVGRTASVENVEVRRVATPRAFWIGPPGETPAFALLDPDVKRLDSVRIAPGVRVTLIGLVRPAPDADRAMRQWGLDDASAEEVERAGTYLHVTEIAEGKP